MKRTEQPQVASYGFAEHCWMVECSVCGPLGSVFSSDTDSYAFEHLRDAHGIDNGVKL